MSCQDEGKQILSDCKASSSSTLPLTDSAGPVHSEPSPTSDASLSSTSEVTPQSLLSLLQCPICSPSTLLKSPTTLSCGHTVCVSHVIPSLSSSPPCGRPTMPSCPLPTCTTESQASLPHANMPSELIVAYFPPRGTQVQTDSPVATAHVQLQEARLDVVTSKIVDLISQASFSEDWREEKVDAFSGSSDEVHSGLDSERRQSISCKFKQSLLTELTCEICFLLLYKPVTTPCQHTFCAKCLQRSLDHNNHCPICRTHLPGFTFVQGHPPNKLISALILRVFPDIYSERQISIEEDERNTRLNTPIFVCQLSFPGTPTILHIFEPRYRLMLRRCLESATPKFGMILPPGDDGRITEFGTLLEIQAVKMLPDGRSIIKTRGTERFRLLETGYLDGYMVGQIELIEDLSLEIDDVLNTDPVSLGIEHAEFSSVITESLDRGVPATPEELVEVCNEFLGKLRNNSAPWVVQRLNRMYGPQPEDPNHFCFWIASILPIDEYAKARLLPIRSSWLRLQLVVRWIRQLNSTSWSPNGCMIQ